MRKSQYDVGIKLLNSYSSNQEITIFMLLVIYFIFILKKTTQFS